MQPIALKELFSPEGRRNPYPFYARLHQLGQACSVDPEVDRYAAVVNGYEAIEQVMRSPMFKMLDDVYLDYLDGGPDPLWRRRPSLQTLQRTIFFLNPPDHTRLRKIFAGVFTGRRVAKLEPAVIKLIDRRLDRMEELGAGGQVVDFMKEFAYPLPSDVIGELIGVPDADRPWFPPRSEPFSLVLEPGPNNWRYLRDGDKAAHELRAYFAELVAARRAQPQEDLVSALVQDQAAQADMTDEELVANLIGIYNAGFLTSVHSIGSGLVLLLERPEHCAVLRAHPEKGVPYTEEILRFKTPVQFGVRWAIEDTEVMGVPVPKGKEALILLAAANWDPRRFTDPHVFDPGRPHNQPMSFSVGPHYCIGAALSRMEIQLSMPMILQRFPKLKLAAEPKTLDLLTFHGYKEVPVTLT